MQQHSATQCAPARGTGPASCPGSCTPPPAAAAGRRPVSAAHAPAARQHNCWVVAHSRHHSSSRSSNSSSSSRAAAVGFDMSNDSSGCRGGLKCQLWYKHVPATCWQLVVGLLMVAVWERGGDCGRIELGACCLAAALCSIVYRCCTGTQQKQAQWAHGTLRWPTSAAMCTHSDDIWLCT